MNSLCWYFTIEREKQIFHFVKTHALPNWAALYSKHEIRATSGKNSLMPDL